MPEISKIEKQKRIRIVMEWIIDDYAYADIVTQVMAKWSIEERQAKRYIKDAREAWGKNEDERVELKRRRKIESLKKLKRSLQEKYRGTPAGIRAVMDVENKLIVLEGLEPAKRVELTGKDGKPIQTQTLAQDAIDYEKLSTAALEEILNARKSKNELAEEDTDD